MKILMFRPSHYPEIAGGTHLGIDLIEDIINSGHEVVLITPAPWRVTEEIKKKYKKIKTEIQYDGKLTIRRVFVSANEKSLLSRALRMFLLTAGMGFKAFQEKNVDIIMSHSMPVFIGPTSVFISRFKKLPLLYLESDVVSESLISTDIVKKGIKQKLMYSFGKFLENISLNGSDHIITVSNLFMTRNIENGIPGNKIEVIHNWIDTNKVKPVDRQQNFLFDRFGLDRNKFYVTYCGNLGLPQNVEILIDAARELEYISDLEIVIVGNGVRREFIKDYIEKLNLKNVKLFPLQPLEEVSYVYSLGNVGVVIGRSGTSKNGFPSKTWTMMAAGQAIISCFDLDSELSQAVIDGKCGIALEPDNSKKLKNAILEMYNNKNAVYQYGLNSRQFVVENYSRNVATKKYIGALEKLNVKNGDKQYVQQ
jgi:colanic acid biosynthesis glycosyl transferase WcaI